MLDGESVLALIPARGGSEGIERKNVRSLGGKPLVAWAIDVADEVASIDTTLVSTDDREIADVAREYGAAVSDRPDRLATDDALVIDTIRYTLDELRASGDGPGYVVMLEPTTPFRDPGDVERCLDRLATEDVDSVATFTEAEVNPHRTWRIEDDAPEPFLPDADPWQPRQSLPDAYQLNGAVYAFDADAVSDEGASLLFGNSAAVEMPPGRSLDIDTPTDLAVAEALLEAGHV